MSASIHRGIGDRIRGVVGKDTIMSGRLGGIAERLIRRISARLADWFLLYLAYRYLSVWAAVPLTLVYLFWSVYRYDGVTFIQNQFGVRLVNSEGEPAFVAQAFLRQAAAMFVFLVFLWLNHAIAWGDRIVLLLLLANVLPALGRSRRVLLDHLVNTDVYVMRSALIVRRDVDLAQLVTASLRKRALALGLDSLMASSLWLAAGWWGVFVSPVLLVWSLYRNEGCTIGHRICGLRIVDLEGQPLSFQRALTRQFVYKHLLSTVTFGLSIWASALLARCGPGRDQRRAIQDYGAHSWVVKAKSLAAALEPKK
jgi:uncharacterized RDD family membrane protein YckC